MDPPVPTHLSTRTERRNGMRILFVSGEIDLSSAPRFGRALDDALGPGEVLVADLTGVEFIDSAGVRVLALAKRAAETQRVRLLIIPSMIVSHVLEISGLDRAFQVHDALCDALAVIDGQAGGSMRPPATEELDEA